MKLKKDEEYLKVLEACQNLASVWREECRKNKEAIDKLSNDFKVDLQEDRQGWSGLVKEIADSIIGLCDVMKRFSQSLVIAAVCSGVGAVIALLWLTLQTISWLTA